MHADIALARLCRISDRNAIYSFSKTVLLPNVDGILAYDFDI